MAGNMFRLLSRLVDKLIPGRFLLSTATSRWSHSGRLPFTGPPSYDTIFRRFSSDIDPQAFVIRKHGQEAKDRGEFIDIHGVGPEYSPGPDEYDVMLTDVTYQKLQASIAGELGIDGVAL
ncbi:hypothetical protein C7212DRAFT_362071 [Tuber magnatum]|uniref:Uncharacterized protein n=1 Tax=Tuber magnatum TaxID=42249 RepID=A0A317SZ08_9PEZI|nr:hypothetical protein C7212DRAFT_362071 [Tuber magnatum]